MAVLLSGCASYTSLPLATAAPLAASLPAPPAPQIHATLTVDDVVRLALAYNPDLKAARLKHGVADAQLGQAGILPNPNLSASILPLISGAGSVPAWSIGLSQNIRAFVTYRSQVRAAGDAVRQVDAEILWQEWQVAGQARRLAFDLILGARSRPSYAAAYALLLERNARLETALRAGDVTLATLAPDRVTLEAARAALDALDQRQLSTLHQLDALLGLAPGVAVPLADATELPAFDAAAVEADLASLADRRPDLLALRLGYAQADERARAAILAQFPDLVLGLGVNSDNAKVINGGPNVSLGLPLFDRGQGGVAIARATRAQLHADYSARLATAAGQARAELAEIAQLSAQLSAARRDLPAARLAADRAAQAFSASHLDERAYVDLVTNGFTKEQTIMSLELALADRQIALQTLTGAGLPSVATDAGPVAQP